MQVEYDDVFKPTTVVQRGKKDQSKFLVSITVAPTPGGLRIYFFGHFFTKNCMKMKKVMAFSILFISRLDLLFEQNITLEFKTTWSLTEKLS